MASIFTRIVNGEIPCYKIAEDAEHLAFLDINPVQKGHTLVIPKMEIDYLFDLDDEQLSSLMVFAKKCAARIKKATGCKRVAVVVLGMEVPHAHIHLIPINSEGDVNFAHKLQLSKEEFVEVCTMISQA